MTRFDRGLSSFRIVVHRNLTGADLADPTIHYVIHSQTMYEIRMLTLQVFDTP